MQHCLYFEILPIGGISASILLLDYLFEGEQTYLLAPSDCLRIAVSSKVSQVGHFILGFVKYSYFLSL
jgi:hypothetical protein